MQPLRKSPKRDSSGSRSYILQGTIPNVLEWVHAFMDCHTSIQDRQLSMVQVKKTTAQEISTRRNVRIDFEGGHDWWKGELRFWENVCGMAVKLPSEGKGSNIFEAMRTYPSSILVFSGLRTVFGRYMVVGNSRIRRPSLSQNAISFFGPSGSYSDGARGWFEPEAYGRLQEMVIHLSAVAEYVLRGVRCAFRKCSRDESGKRFKFSTEERIEETQSNGRKVIQLLNVTELGALSEEDVCCSLAKSMDIAHSSVIDGAAIAGEKHGQKRSKSDERRRVRMVMLRRPLHEVLDLFVEKIAVVVKEFTTNDLDMNDFYIQMTKLLRKVEKIYIEIGVASFEDLSEQKLQSSSQEAQYTHRSLKRESGM
ncbi:hypothetical protein FGB62_397g00 [Gracilaria domingensis]|nr:hypothetical protein FGB62_397g00 [Gracilaria domingensis]